MDKAANKYNRRQKDILRALLDKFEKSKTYREENAVKQTFKVRPDEFFEDFDSDFVDIDAQEDFVDDLKCLERDNLVELSVKNNVIQSIIMVLASKDLYYKIIGRNELKEIENEQISMYESLIGSNPLTDRFCYEQIERLKGRKKAEYEPSEAQILVNTISYILSLKQEVLERELSIELFSNSKVFKDKYRGKVLTILKKYGDYKDITENVPDETEQNHAILAEHNVYPNPTYVNFKGSGKIIFKEKEPVILYPNIPIAIDSECLSEIDTVIINSKRIITIENLTSFNRVKDDDSFFIYLAGYHNHAKQAFIKAIARSNNGKEWYHFGDIDPDGFYILKHLKTGTGIPFNGMLMSADKLKTYEKYCKPLEKNDITKAKSLIEKGLYVDVMGYMLQHNKKLEQEVISWKENPLKMPESF